MSDLLLEIGCEEIPARMLDDARQVLQLNVWELLGKHGIAPRDVSGKVIEPESISAFSTPRRLGLLIRSLPERQADRTERIIGPAIKVAFKAGNPTAAAEAFAKKVGRNVSELDRIQTEKGEYISAAIDLPGRPVIEILAEHLHKTIGETYWPKTMYWRGKGKERFVRPVRWIVALFGRDVISFEFAGIKSGRISKGHRILAAGDVTIAEPNEYEQVLRKAFVIPLRADRNAFISEQLVGKAGQHLRIRENDPHFLSLLDTVTNLTEWPSVIKGSFDENFLSLPDEVTTTVMRDHQKYFAVEDTSGKLAPYFLAVLNTDGDPNGLIRHGNERVLRARFNDARFFWDTDQKTPLKDRVEMLKAVTFHKDLGSYADKAGRMESLVANLVRWPGIAKPGLDADATIRAAQLAKTDLTTELVKEFTELQGIIGGLYARAQGLNAALADAIYDQYKPASMEDTPPRTLEGALLAIADKADSIAGMFALGMVPSGSKDPFALRRQANGIIKTIAEHKLPLRIWALMADARERYRGSGAEKKFKLDDKAYKEAIQAFFRERLEFYLRDFCGLAYDVVNATLAADADDVVDAAARASAVAKVRPSADFEAISTSFKRMKNILRQARETGKRVALPCSPALLPEDAEKKLVAEIPHVADKAKKLRSGKQYEQALLEISRLRPLIDTFFDKVMVMVEDEELRAQRLGLLQTLVDEFSSIADFSEIVTEKK